MFSYLLNRNPLIDRFILIRILEIAAGHRLLVTIEENVIAGGAGSAVLEMLADAGLPTPVLRIGLADCFQPHGDTRDLRQANGLDARPERRDRQSGRESAGISR